MTIEEKAGLIIATRRYRFQKKKKRVDGTDFSVLDTTSDEKILLRSMEPQDKAGYVGVDDVRKMLKEMKSQKCDRGVFISNRFTEAASEEMALSKIQPVPDAYMPPVKPESLYLVVSDSLDKQCRGKCGGTPLRQSDCRSWTNGDSCRIRTISENASFHFERGWMNLLNDDLRQLLSLPKSSRSMIATAPNSGGKL